MEMESNSMLHREDEQMKLPPGFRFHPTDEELIIHYLAEKVMDNNFCAIAIGEADLNKIEPWDLPKHAKMGEKEWYFFVVRDRKYPTGLRTNRATEAGYWKATGKDKEIYRAKALVGMKKTLVFYTGRAPKGEKTNWVMHEYRLEGKYFKYKLFKNTKDDWVISRIFNKSSSGKKPDVTEITSVNELHSSFLPPLMDPSNTFHVTCFTNNTFMLEDQSQSTKQEQASMFDTSTSMTLATSCSKTSGSNMLPEPHMPDVPFADACFLQDQSMLKLLLEGKGGTNSNSSKIPTTIDTFSGLSNPKNINSLTGPYDHESFWNY